jgi:UDP-N-acetylmuramoyl-tripeptide--D-alanyl-D-alanine ligase
LTLLRLRRHHAIAVLEIGIDAPGAMQRHMALARPTAAICTAISPEHMENFQDLSEVAREELICFDTVVENGGIVAINCDDPLIHPCLSLYPREQTCGFSLCEQPSQGDKEIVQGWFLPPQTLSLTSNHQEPKVLSLPLPGKHHARNVLGALSLGLALGQSLELMISKIESTESQPGRCEVNVLASNITVLCDYYNASPASMVSGLETVTLFSGPQGRRIACLGDMLELGLNEESFHRDLAATLRDLGFRVVLTLGPRMRWVIDELKAQGFEGRAAHFEEHGELTQELNHLIEEGDTILIKGSRSMRMELIWRGMTSSKSARELH